MIGTTLLDRYRLDSELGRGGMGVVYRAHDTLLDRAVAVKVLSDSGLGTEGRARLLREAQAAAKLNHSNIVTVYDAGEADPSGLKDPKGLTPFIVMELVEGESLFHRKPQSLDEILSVARQLCAALEHAHTNGIVHRDLKPENILVTNDGTAKLMDFGLARSTASRLTAEGTIVGTVFYLAPEQALGEPFDGRADLYSLGVMLYELVVGRLPFDGENALTIISQHIHTPVESPRVHRADLPPALEAIILQLLAKNPADRPASAREVARMLSEMGEGGQPKPARVSLNNLPSRLTSFIGREKEIAEVKRRLSVSRLLSLTGPGGTGKTRLSLQVAADLLDTFPDGAWLVELAPLADPALVPQAVATVLDMRNESGRPLLAALTDYLRERTLLLILDNCEHVIDACAQLAEHLLTQCPDVRLLASSREALGIEGEAGFRVPSLSLPPANGATREALADSEAVQLFVERASAILPGFALTDANAPAMALVCKRLDGIPLAIELAASRVKLLKVEQIAARLDDAFRLLTGGSRTALPRQQTLRATIDWSHNLLSDSERALLRRLSVFAGGWSLEAAEDICVERKDESGLEPSDVLDLLTHLVNKSLVVVEREQGEEARYRLLETIRQYAREKLRESGEGETVRERHLAYFLQFAERAEPELHRRDQAAWLARLEVEHDNLRAAIGWSLEAQADAGVRMGAALSEFWDTRGYLSEGRQWLDQALAATEDSPHTPARAKAIYGACMLAIRQTDMSRAKALSEEGLALSRELDYKPGIAMGLVGLSMFAEFEGVAPERVDALRIESLELWREVGDKRGIGRALGPLASRASSRYDYEEAARLFSESLALFREVGDEREIAGALWNLAEVAIAQCNYERARALAEESLALYRKLSDKHGIATVLRTLGAVAHNQGDGAQAQAQYEESETLFRELGDRDCLALTLCGLGRVAALDLLGRSILAQGDEPRARQFLAEALTLQRELGNKRSIAPLFEGLAGAVIAGEQPPLLRAVRLLGAAEGLRESIATPLAPAQHADYDRNLAAVRSALSEEAFAAAWAEGRAMTMEQAMTYALGDTAH